MKHTDDGTTGIDTPEEGAQFQIYRKSAGSFDAAPETEQDTLTCDADGCAESRICPTAPMWCIRPLAGMAGQMPDFEVQITEQNKTYRYLLNDAILKSSIEIVKRTPRPRRSSRWRALAFRCGARQRANSLLST